MYIKNKKVEFDESIEREHVKYHCCICGDIFNEDFNQAYQRYLERGNYCEKCNIVAANKHHPMRKHGSRF